MTDDNSWVLRAGDSAAGRWEAVVDSSIPGWSYTGLRIGRLAEGQTLRLDAAPVERVIVPLSGAFRVAHDGMVALLEGRRSVFEGPTDVLYVGSSTAAAITGVGSFAVAEAATAVRKPSVLVPRSAVPVELRGAGRASRQVHNFGTPEALDADRIIVCEVITPAGNWSSYPAHKHDEFIPGHESCLEEIYYFESAPTRGGSAPPDAEPFGLFSVHGSPAGDIEVASRVRTGDIVLVPFGYHGPAAATPDYDLYYLNVMAGPGPERQWRATDDPAQAWVRTDWAGQSIDARLPFGTD